MTARSENVSCSQCGRDFGRGEHGFSHCDQHTGWKRDRMLRRSAAARKGWVTRQKKVAIGNATDQMIETTS